MIRHLKGVLSADQLRQVRESAARTQFVDGRATNRGTSLKNNLQVPQNDPAAEEPGRIVRDALFRNAELAAWAFPRQVARPTLSRYEPGMYYGIHCDEALFPSQPPMRSDVSCTIFLSEPADYEGGELVMHLGPEQLPIKYPAGDAVLYPTDAIHEVRPVTSGVRLVAITWIQSYIPDPKHREILGRYHSLVRKLGRDQDPETLVEIDYIRTNLMRMWTDV